MEPELGAKRKSPLTPPSWPLPGGWLRVAGAGERPEVGVRGVLRPGRLRRAGSPPRPAAPRPHVGAVGRSGGLLAGAPLLLTPGRPSAAHAAGERPLVGLARPERQPLESALVVKGGDEP